MSTQQEKKEQDWTQRFGDMVANLYDDHLTVLTHNELGSSIIEIATLANTPENEARILLPLGLQEIFDEAPFIRINLHINKEPILLYEIKEGDLVQNFETLINGINEMCRHWHIPTEVDEAYNELAKALPVLTVEFVRDDGVTFNLYKQLWLKSALTTLCSFIEGKFKTATVTKPEPKTLPQTVFNLCDYEKLSLDFHLTEDGDKVFNFEFVREQRGVDEIYFNTEGVNRTSFNRDGYNFPLRDNHKGEGREDVTLAGAGNIEFLGYKNERAFLLTWRRIKGHFEAEFDLYDAKGNVVQTLNILE
jgi:hypothetical protein